jgi:hypothetical protein
MPELVTRMTMGQDVPEWLMVAEPEQPGAPKGHFRFCVDVDVIDTPNYYAVMPNLALYNGPVIDNSGMMGHRIMAAGKPVFLVATGGAFFDSSTTPQFRELEQQQAEMRIVQQLQPQPVGWTFWRRVVYALTGR